MRGRSSPGTGHGGKFLPREGGCVMNIGRALARLASLSIAVAAFAMVWTPGAALAATQNCQPGSGPPCKQAFLEINKTTGAVSAAAALPGGNQEGADYDGVECQLGSSGRCFLAAAPRGFLPLRL